MHNYAYLTRIPFTGADVAAGANDWTACRIVGEVSVMPNYRKNLEDENEDGELVGETHFDLETKIQLTLGIPAGFVMPDKNSVVVLDTADAVGLQYNGNYQLEEIGPVFKSGDRAEVKVTLRKNENLTLTP